MECFGVANRSAEREDAGAAVSHEQVKLAPPRYPVDRYLVESSNKIEMVNITADEIWNTEPAIRPEDEVVLRKLHEMLQSTADDLKLISGELIKGREPRKQIKGTPLDEEFNEKVHIEEIVNAKFHGYQIAEKPLQVRVKDPKIVIQTPIKSKPKAINASVQVNQLLNTKKSSTTKNLTISRTRLLQIDEQPQSTNSRAKNKAPLVTYNEYAYKYDEPEQKTNQEKPLDIQTMPSINIRGELKHQKVLQLDIVPEQKTDVENLLTLNNVAVIAMQHEATPIVERPSTYPEVRYMSNTFKPAVRKVSTMLTCDSSESSGNIVIQAKLKDRNLNKSNRRPSPKPSAPIKSKFTENHKAKTEQPFKSNIDEWRKKINTIYGGPSTSKKPSGAKSTASTDRTSRKVSSKSESNPTQRDNKPKSLLNNAEYIPYSKLTLGGVNVSDIEREISDLTDKNVPLSPILDKILISRENSFHESASKKDNANKNILTTSDENLLEEVLDIERNITTTLNKNLKGKDNTLSDISSESNQSGKSYADDFEEERSDNEKTSEENKSKQSNVPKDENIINHHIQTEIQDTTYTKSPKLNFKNTVDVFEFIHSIDKQDNATQSNCSYKISLKSTQTSPRNVQPIRNDLWPEPSQTPIINPTSDVEKIFNEDFIKKLIVDECTDILQKNISKPSTSKEDEKKNFVTSQRKTQTSPAHVKSVMTSPTRTKTRMTSPLALSLTVDQKTSPIDFPTNEDNLHIGLDKIEDLAISINLSSPRFSLRLPKSSREVLSNLDGNKTERKGYKPVAVKNFTSSSSADADYSSDMSSLGEIKDKLRRRQRRTKYPSISESTSSSSKCSSDVSSVVILLKSEGEISLGQMERRKILSRSDGEMSLGLR